MSRLAHYCVIFKVITAATTLENNSINGKLVIRLKYVRLVKVHRELKYIISYYSRIVNGQTLYFLPFICVPSLPLTITACDSTFEDMKSLLSLSSTGILKLN